MVLALKKVKKLQREMTPGKKDLRGWGVAHDVGR